MEQIVNFDASVLGQCNITKLNGHRTIERQSIPFVAVFHFARFRLEYR
jgi:hypothetical protein